MIKLVLITGQIFGCLMLVAAGGLCALAQEAPTVNTNVQTDFQVERDIDVTVPPVPALAPLPPLPPTEPLHNFTFNFVSSEMSFDRKIVKGAPYSADAVTETIKTLADGNRIVRKSSTKLFRDGEGRTRREQTLTSVGPFATADDPPQIILINDPVAGVNYSLSPRHQIARKIKFGESMMKARALAALPPSVKGDVLTRAPHGATVESPRVMIYDGANGAGVIDGVTQEFRIAKVGPNATKPVTESLGVQTVGGVSAEGTRTTTTIPAGQIGNERPIEIVSERWYSPELQTVVMTKRNDPQNGETTYRLTNINRSEPAPSLFEVPSDYKVQDTPANFQFRTQRKIEENK